MASDQTTHIEPEALERALLLGRPVRRRLQQANPARRLDLATSLADHHWIGYQLGLSGARLNLLSLLNAAMRRTIDRFFAQTALQGDRDQVRIAATPHPLPELPALFRSLCASYAPAGIPHSLFTSSKHSRHPAFQTLLGELFLLDVCFDNPALAIEQATFADPDFPAQGAWRQAVARVNALLRETGPPSPWGVDLTTLLRKPISAAPDDLDAQVGFVLTHWAAWLPPSLVRQLKVARAIAAEESRPRLGGPGPTQVPGLLHDRELPAAFSADSGWMPQTVLLAKSIYVWLDQLSRRYGWEIRTLDQIPDPELDRLAGWGFTSLWLIGIWERSPASRRIKQMRGNPEAEASAYALLSYRVAADLGGDAALADLEERCTRRGIRLACDVVPNHTGIDSEWVRHHPDWFVQSPEPPYPGYRFTGPDLCDDAGISIRIEDGYWNHTDAAVVFEHLDHGSGQRRYLYHGNDGTHMPWNDTAQLNFLRTEVRQAMSDLIVAVARRFRLIRFDAAMTLARKHYRRLWFPPPGGSAGVPSRSNFWMDDAEFDRLFPQEFWRELVDRINREVPDTLLIAEAFWLMESYFVRSLGMHRVYNSAFMNLLKNEENAKFRRMLKETLAFNPEILKRYVNFMNNPDEATAVAQFGKGDKYFGVAVLLATLPGLPMFGHGQVEGLEERYGMEYRRAYWDEQPDEGFIAYHEQKIFPLLRRRALFADVVDFRLYDFETDGGPNENIIAYSNGPPGQRLLVVYNNSPHATTGRMVQAVPMARPDREGEPLETGTLADQLGLNAASGDFCRFRNHQDNCDYLRPLEELRRGLQLSVQGYQAYVFHDFRALSDTDGSWAALHAELAGRPVASLDRALLDRRYQVLWECWERLVDPARLRVLTGAMTTAPGSPTQRQIVDALADDLLACLEQLAHALGQEPNSTEGLRRQLQTETTRLARLFSQGAASPERTLLCASWLGRDQVPGLAYVLFCWRLLELLRLGLSRHAAATDPWEILSRFGLIERWWTRQDYAGTWRELIPLLLESARLTPLAEATPRGFASLVRSAIAAQPLGINRHAGETWFRRESMEAWCAALALQAVWLAPTAKATTAKRIARRLTRRQQLIETSGYRLDNFLQLG